MLLPSIPPTVPVPIEPQICQATCAIMKLSFDEEYRRAMNELGKLHLEVGSTEVTVAQW